MAKKRKSSPSKKASPKKTSKKKPLKGASKRGRKPANKPKIQRGFAVSGFNRARKLIWQNHKSDFENYRDFLRSRIIKDVYEQCKRADCTDEELLSTYQTFREPTEPPSLDNRLKIPMSYFDINDTFWHSFPPFLYVKSPDLIPSTSPYSLFLGVTYLGRPYIDKKTGKEEDNFQLYPYTFKPFCDWCNTFRSEFVEGGWSGSDEAPMLRFTEPEFDAETGRWITMVIPCDSSGNLYNWGFTPTGDDFADGTFVPETEVPTTTTETPITPVSPEDERKKKIENDNSLRQNILEAIQSLEDNTKSINQNIKSTLENIKIAKEVDLDKDIIDEFKINIKQDNQKIKENNETISALKQMLKDI
jgi:hypothetical protein